jgi:hypothetical protein
MKHSWTGLKQRKSQVLLLNRWSVVYIHDAVVLAWPAVNWTGILELLPLGYSYMAIIE